jgi:hypothetical protein
MVHCLPIEVPSLHENSQPRIAAGALQSTGLQADVEPLQLPSCLHILVLVPVMLKPYLHANLQVAPYLMLDELKAPFAARHFMVPSEGRIREAHFVDVHLGFTPDQSPASVQIRLGDPTRFFPFLHPNVHVFPSVVPEHLTVPPVGFGGSGHLTWMQSFGPCHWPVSMHFSTPLPGGRKPAGHRSVHVLCTSVPIRQFAIAPFLTCGLPQLTGRHSETLPDHLPDFLHSRCLPSLLTL